jgi:ATP-dependent Clp protease protease subunit
MTRIPKNIIFSAKPAADDDDNEESNEIETSDSTIYFYTPVTKKSVLNINKQIRKLNLDLEVAAKTLDIPTPEIKIRINSPGGSLLDCFAAVDTIRKSNAPIHTIVEGTAASAATLMSVVSKKRSITKHSFMLIHQLSGGMWGKFEDMKDDMQNCNVFMETINQIYAQYTKIPKNTLKDILKRDIYFDAKTCLKFGLVDHVID